MAINIQNFAPEPGQNYMINGTGANSTNQQITQPINSTQGQSWTDMRIYNSTADRAFVAWAMGTATATATADAANSIAVGPGVTEVFNTGAIGSVAVILGTSTSAGKVYISMGNGA